MLTGRRAAVTGAASGIGRAIAAEFVRAGSHVHCLDVDGDAAAAAAAEIGASATPHTCDVTDVGAVASTFADIGELDILVNCAGIIRRDDFEKFTEKDWDDVMGINIDAVFFLSQQFVREALARKAPAKIINIASMLSFQGGIRVPSYTASKSAVQGLTRLIASEMGGKGINCNAIAPGYMATDNTAPLRADAERSASILARIPAGRWGTPDDLKGAVVFLASPASDYVNGYTVAVDGGWLAR
jgi:2-deoxy-D-gluconate 3-dehydrogenase